MPILVSLSHKVPPPWVWRSFALLLALICMIPGIGCAKGQPKSEPLTDAQITVRVGQVARKMLSDGAPSVVIGVAYQGRIFTFHYGEFPTSTRAESTTVYEIGSVTKSFTATLLAIEVEQGIVRLDDPAQKYMPAGVRLPDHQGRPITLEDLATHTSGLPRGVPLRGQQTSDRAMFDFINQYQLGRTPGSQYDYSNLGFALLAHAVANAANADWESLVEREICEPLGMVDTRITLTDDERSRLARGYDVHGLSAPMGMPTWPAFNGSGALRSTLNDMVKYLQFNMGLAHNRLARVLPTLQKVRRPTDIGSIGLAWEMYPLAAGSTTQVIAKDGNTRGFGAYVAFVPETKTGIVLLVNWANGPDDAGMQILRFLNGFGAH